MKRLSLVAAVMLMLFFCSGCKKYVKQGDMEGGIVLTFDDNYINDWYQYLPILDSFGAKATFYVSHYTFLTAQQKQKLKIIQQHGYEIGFHTTHHADLPSLLKNKSLREVMEQEVKVALDSMKKDGFRVKNFAYPFGKHNDVLDAAMLSLFRSVRLLNGTNDYSKSVCTKSNKTFLRSLNIDNGGVSSTVIDKMMSSAKQNNNAVVFLAHKINSGQMSISESRLIYILSKAKQLGLKFYNVQDLCR